MDCSTWWIDHVSETYVYVMMTKSQDARGQDKAVQNLIGGVKSWADLLNQPDAGVLMGDHVAAAKALVDGAFAHDATTINQAVEQLLGNVAQQTELYQKSIPGFPGEEWTKLFTTHVTATGGYVLALASGDDADFRKNWNVVRSNMAALARFWGHVCVVLMGR